MNKNDPRSLIQGVINLVCVFTLFLLLLAVRTTHASTKVEGVTTLPELGNPSQQVLSPAQAATIGQRFYLQARSQANFVADPQISHYIQALGEQLVNSNDLGNQSFTFFVLDNPTINAFAVPGGYIGFYSGLIEITQNESQLASVVAHEIAHVSQSHLARIYARQENVSLATMAAVLAGILANSQGNAQVGAAAIYAGVAGGVQSQITFTREHELEADRIGIRLMNGSRYDTQGMAEMFSLMQRASLQTEDERYAFLRTHPLTSQRVAEARSFASANGNPDAISDSLDYRLIKARLRGLTATNPTQLLRTLADEATASTPAIGDLYLLALTHQRLAQHRAALRYAEKIVTQHPRSIYAQLLLLHSLLALENYPRADVILSELRANFPHHYPILAAHDEFALLASEHAAARDIWLDYLFSTPTPVPEAFRKLAVHQQALGKLAASRISMAEYLSRTGDQTAAHQQLKLALKTPDLSDDDKSRVEAKLEEIEQTRKRGDE